MYVFLKLLLLISLAGGKNVNNIRQNNISTTNTSMFDASALTVQTFSNETNNGTTPPIITQSSFHNRSHDNIDDVSELLEIIEKSFISYGEDLVEGCIDEAELQKILQEHKTTNSQKVLKLFLVLFILCCVSNVVSVYALVLICRKPNKKWTTVKKRGYKQSFVNESDTSQVSDPCQDMDNDTTFLPDIQGSTSNSVRCRHSSSRCYTVQV